MCDTQPNRTSLATGPVLSLLTVASVPVPLSSVNAYGGFVRGNCHRKTCEPNGNESFVFLFFYLFLLQSRILALYIYYTVRESNKRLNGFPRIADWAAHETTCVVNVKNKRKNRGRWQKKKGQRDLDSSSFFYFHSYHLVVYVTTRGRKRQVEPFCIALPFRLSCSISSISCLFLFCLLLSFSALILYSVVI